MSARTKKPRRIRRESDPKDLVGRDFAGRGSTANRWRHRAAAVVIGLVLGGLLLASLRMEIVRTRYALADALAQETRLLSLEREASVALRELRDPRRLRRLANQLGFVRPERVIELGTDLAARGGAAPSAVVMP